MRAMERIERFVKMKHSAPTLRVFYCKIFNLYIPVTLRLTTLLECVISGFGREVDENCALLGYYSASIYNLLPTFQDKLLDPSSDVKNATKRLS
jgi:hypothetical protein